MLHKDVKILTIGTIFLLNYNSKRQKEQALLENSLFLALPGLGAC